MSPEPATRKTQPHEWDKLPVQEALLLQRLTTTGVECMKDYNALMKIKLPRLAILEQVRSKNKNITNYRANKFYKALGYRITQRLNAPDTNILSVMASLRETHFQEPLKADLIKETPFYKNSLNLVFGLSKSGKSESTARVLKEAGLGKNNVIWLDKDYNVNTTTLGIMYSFTYLNSNIEEVEEKLLETDGQGTILIFDSLKDFTKGDDLDTNGGSQRVMEYIREFTKMNYTVIVIAHATKDSNYKGGVKIKGNEETIKSKCDIVFRFNKNDEFREFECIASRLANSSYERFKCYDLSVVKSKVDAIIKATDGDISVRDLTNKLPSSIRNTFTTHQNELIMVVHEGKKNLAKCIQAA